MDMEFDDNIAQQSKEDFKNENLKNEEDSIIADITNLQIEDEEEKREKTMFNPPVYIQRYLKVVDVIEEIISSKEVKEEPRTIMDVGCAEFKMQVYLKHIPTVEKVIYLDKDESTLTDTKHNLKPLCAEYLNRRPFPFVNEVYSGCITECDPRVFYANPRLDFIIGIEIIEHLYPDILAGFEKTVFGLLSPKFVIITTPNSEFNTVFDLKEGSFRHWDHKFEWTRDEFDNWCKKISSEYDYTYTVQGIGKGTPETEELGCVSQMALFRKTETDLSVEELQASKLSKYPGILKEGAYKLLETIAYPVCDDKRTLEEKIVDEFKYYVFNYVFKINNLYEYWEEEKTHIEVELNRFKNCLKTKINELRSANQLFIKDVLEKAGYEIIQKTDEPHEFHVRHKVPTESETFPSKSESEESDVEIEPPNFKKVRLNENVDINETWD